jgi:hypothetical protein
MDRSEVGPNPNAYKLTNIPLSATFELVYTNGGITYSEYSHAPRSPEHDYNVHSEFESCCCLPGICCCCASDIKPGGRQDATSAFKYKYDEFHGTLTQGYFKRKLLTSAKELPPEVRDVLPPMPGGRVSSFCCCLFGEEYLTPPPLTSWDIMSDGTISLRSSNGVLVLGVGVGSDKGDIVTLVYANSPQAIRFKSVLEFARARELDDLPV